MEGRPVRAVRAAAGLERHRLPTEPARVPDTSEAGHASARASGGARGLRGTPPMGSAGDLAADSTSSNSTCSRLHRGGSLRSHSTSTLLPQAESKGSKVTTILVDEEEDVSSRLDVPVQTDAGDLAGDSVCSSSTSSLLPRRRSSRWHSPSTRRSPLRGFLSPGSQHSKSPGSQHSKVTASLVDEEEDNMSSLDLCVHLN